MARSLALCVAATIGAGCATLDDADTGRVDLALTGQSPSGATYRLRDATVTVDGAGGPYVFATEDDPDRTAFAATLEAGPYALTLAPGWRFERVDAGGATTPVMATLLSPNPQGFQITADQLTRVALRFRVDGDIVELGDGDLEVVLEVEDQPPVPTALGWPERLPDQEQLMPPRGVAYRITVPAPGFEVHRYQVFADGIGLAIMGVYSDAGGVPGPLAGPASPRVPMVGLEQPTLIPAAQFVLPPGDHWIAFTADFGANVAAAPPGEPVVQRCEFHGPPGVLLPFPPLLGCGPAPAISIAVLSN